MYPVLADFVIARYRWGLLIGLALVALAQALGSAGMISGTMAMFLGACGGTFGRYRQEAGLWMLSAMFLAISCLALVASGGAAIAGVIPGGLPIHLSWDYVVGAAIHILLILFLSVVTRANWLRG